MSVLVWVSMLLCIDIVVATDSAYLMVKISFDRNESCTNINDTMWDLEASIATQIFDNKSIAYEDGYTKCGCAFAQPKCYGTNLIATELTLRFKLKDTSTTLTPFNINGDDLQKSRSDHNIRCGVVTPTSQSDATCPMMLQISTGSGTGNNAELIAGSAIGALAALAALLAYPLYRYIKRENQVDSNNDMSPIVPGDFGITDAPNSIAPAGT